jgi:hypothetical protein
VDPYRSWMARAARAVCDTVSDMNYASRRLFELRLAATAEETDRAPETYAEFLLRSTVTSIHEPPACRR